MRKKPLCAPEAVCISASGDRGEGAMLREERELLEKTPELGEGQIFIYGGCDLEIRDYFCSSSEQMKKNQ